MNAGGTWSGAQLTARAFARLGPNAETAKREFSLSRTLAWVLGFDVLLLAVAKCRACLGFRARSQRVSRLPVHIGGAVPTASKSTRGYMSQATRDNRLQPCWPRPQRPSGRGSINIALGARSRRRPHELRLRRRATHVRCGGTG